MRLTAAILAAVFLAGLGAGVTAAADGVTEPKRLPSGKEIIDASGVKGGLVVHVGCGDGRLTAALRVGDSFVVHGLDADAKNVAKARRHIRSRGLYGKVAVDVFDGARLPYVDNLVNLLVAEKLGKPPMAEVMRVLAPGGVAMIGPKKIVKPRPKEIDEWTHHLHGPDNNALADDRVVGPPRHMQWLAGPMWTRHHHADKGTYPAIRAVVSAKGRLYYMVDETRSSNRAVPSTWFLAARDGFSGVLLWKRRLGVATFERRLEQLWRTLIADGDRVYASLGEGKPLSALDGATGAVIRSYRGTEGLREMVKDGGTLFAVGRENVILAVGADSGKLLWRWDPRKDGAIVPVTLAASDGKVFVRTDKGVSCLSADQGKKLWRVALAGSQKNIRLRWPRERLIVTDGVVLCSYGGKDPKVLDRDKWEYLGSHPRVNDYGGKLAALSAKDGSVLWRTVYRPGLESMPGEIYISDGVVWLGPDFARPRDLRTGAVKRTRPVLERLWTTGHHYRCYPGKATSRYIITAKRGIEMIDLVGENHSRNNWVRGTCRVGVTPCNGLIYAPPHSCGCYMEAKLYGFWALAPARAERAPPKRARLERGPAYGSIVNRQSAFAKATADKSSIDNRGDWRTYRGDPARSGSTKAAVPSDLRQLWKADVGGPSSPDGSVVASSLGGVTVAEGKVLVADVDAHTVHALDARNGKPLWRFTAGGRVDSPPTLHEGLALFGSRDGWVYCLRASDGALVWRFMAAPQRINAVAREQVESLWPVHGSVLIHKGVAYVAAGRSSYLDGGIVLYGLRPATGEVVCKRRVVSEHAGVMDPPSQDQQTRMATQIRQNYTDYKTFLAPDRSDAFSMAGALTDVLTAGGGSIFMRHLRFDGKLVQQKTKRQHLFSTGSLLDGSEHNRSYWLLGTGDFTRLPVAYPWIVGKSLAVPYGLMLAFDDKTVWGIRRGAAKGRGRRQSYTVFAAPRPDPSDKASLLPDFAKRSGKRPAAGRSWTAGLTMRPRAMIRAGDALFIGCQTATSPAKGGVLRVVSCKTGKTLGELKLDSPPVWDGLAAAEGKLLVSLTNGKIVCFGK